MRSASSARSSQESSPERSAGAPSSHAVLRGGIAPGHAVRVPSGLLLACVAAGLLLLIGAYVLGSWRGRAAAESVYREQLLRYGLSATDASFERAIDPLASQPLPDLPASGLTGSGSFLRQSAGESESGTRAGRSDARDAQRDSEAPPAARSGENPIIPGYHYLVIMETNEDGAQRLVAFCREHGLDAHAVRRHNAPNFFVVLLPGYESSNDPGLRHLRDVEVPRIGRIWRTLDPGRADFSDAYAIVIRRE